jgi:hypothetical protein
MATTHRVHCQVFSTVKRQKRQNVWREDLWCALHKIVRDNGSLEKGA